MYNLPTVQELATGNHFLPSVNLENDAGNTLLNFLASHAGAAATFTLGKALYAQGDVLAAFSSRGGAGQTLGISKPDVTAPGRQILAGHTPEPHSAAGGPSGELFQAIEGTSMASPHVAGAAALLKHLHPSWTPGQIKSALMTTALAKRIVKKENGRTPADPFDTGSGRIDLSKAGNPGLTFDASAADYITHAAELWVVNYPSLYIPALSTSISVQRTAHSELSVASTWRLTVTTPPDLKVTVPRTLAVPAGGDAPFTIVVNASAVPSGAVRFATLEMRYRSYAVHLPITIVGQ
jgi:subtilisin family serine protease